MAWKGFNTVAAFVDNENTWASGTAKVAGTGHKVFITSESLVPNAQLIPSDSLTGSPFPAFGDKGDELHAGAVSVEYDFETIHRLLAFAMGTAGTPTEVESTVAWQHDLRFNDSLEGVYTTWVFGQSGLFVREYPLVKHNGFTLAVEHNQRVTGDFGLVPKTLNFNTTAGINELTTLVDYTLPTNADTRYATFNDLVIQINAAGGAGLASPTDDMSFISSVSLDVPGAMLEDDVTVGNAPFVDEPLRNGDLQITGSLNATKLLDTDQLTELLDKSLLKMKWIFTGSAVPGGTTTRSMTFYFSNVQIDTADINVAGKELAPKNLTFRCAKPAAAHTGFSYADALFVEIVNTDAIDPLSNSWPAS
ncbi:MAG: phage tail tube protein [Thermoplasmata archaeon]